MPLSSVAAVHWSASDESVAAVRLTTGRVGGFCSVGVSNASVASNTAWVSLRESWWSSTASTLSPTLSRAAGAVNCRHVVASAVVAVDVGYVLAVSDPLGRLLRAISVPLRYTAAPSSRLIASASSWPALGSSTLKWRTKYWVIWPLGTTVTSPRLPQPSWDGPDAQVETL